MFLRGTSQKNVCSSGLRNQERSQKTPAGAIPVIKDFIVGDLQTVLVVSAIISDLKDMRRAMPTVISELAVTTELY